MARLRPVLTLLGLIGLAALASPLLLGRIPAPAAAQADASNPYRFYSGSAQVLAVKALAGGRCQINVKFHSWLSLSDGFSLGEIPQKGQQYRLTGKGEQCVALEVALAAQGDPGDLKSPRHIAYRAGQLRSGEWVLTEPPRAPVGCSGL